MTDAYTDPGKHKRGTNPCTPRSWRRRARKQARRREAAEARLRDFIDAQNASSPLTDEQLGPRLAARRRDLGARHD